MEIFENYLQREIDSLQAGSGGSFSKAVHDVEDHTGIPGVGGGSAPITTGTVAFADSHVLASMGAESIVYDAAFSSGPDTSWNIGTPTRVNVLTDGTYSLFINNIWLLDTVAGETGLRATSLNASVFDPSNYASYPFTTLPGVQDMMVLDPTISGADLRSQVLTVVGYAKAGDFFEVTVVNHDPAQPSMYVSYLSLTRLL